MVRYQTSLKFFHEFRIHTLPSKSQEIMFYFQRHRLENDQRSVYGFTPPCWFFFSKWLICFVVVVVNSMSLVLGNNGMLMTSAQKAHY